MFNPLPPSIADLFTQSLSPDALLTALMSSLGKALQCDRCFLYIRDPHTKLGRVPVCWVRSPAIPTVYDPDWKPEPASLADDDPMFAAALNLQPSIVVDDVETARADILNRQFEREQFGHRALIHAHLIQDDQFWGVLQPSVFGQPRHWSIADQDMINQVVSLMLPACRAYVNAHRPHIATGITS